MIVKILLAAAVPLLTPVMQAGVVGEPVVVDGATLEVGSDTVLLYGVKAPRAEQACTLGGEPVACGALSKETLEALIDGGSVACTIKGRDSRDRILATCKAGGIDLNRAMVQSGWALADERQSNQFAGAESGPREAGVGLWQDGLDTAPLR